MSIEQWVEHINETEDSQYSCYDVDFKLTERYAAYKLKELNAKIVKYRKLLDEKCKHLNEYWGVYSSDDILNEYDKTFNIEICI